MNTDPLPEYAYTGDGDNYDVAGWVAQTPKGHIDLITALRCCKAAAVQGLIPPLPHDYLVSLDAVLPDIQQSIDYQGCIGAVMQNFCKHSGTSTQVVSIENFEATGMKMYPWDQVVIVDGDHLRRYFAVCPECHNPVELVDLYISPQPFAQHTKTAIPGFACFDATKRDQCSFFRGH